VFVFDLADDQLKQILNRDETVHAAIFINDKRHVHALGLHGLQQGSAWHRGWDREGSPQMVRRLEAFDLRGFIGPRPEGHKQIFDVDEAERIVERVSEDR